MAAFAPCFFLQGTPDYGAFQKRVLVPKELAVPIPEAMSFSEAAMLPMQVLTAWSGWEAIGLPRDMLFSARDGQGMLVWGGASSIGSAAVQVARMMGFRVYVTANERHHEYLEKLGAAKVFDYKSEDVVERIVKAAKEDGVTVNTGFDAVGCLKECLEILKETKGEGATAKLAEAVLLNEDSPTMEGVDVKFVSAPTDKKEQTEFFHFVFNVWLKEKLEKGEFVPSPGIKVIEGGLESVNKGLDEMRQRVSGVKLVLEI